MNVTLSKPAHASPGDPLTGLVTLEMRRLDGDLVLVVIEADGTAWWAPMLKWADAPGAPLEVSP